VHEHVVELGREHDPPSHLHASVISHVRDTLLGGMRLGGTLKATTRTAQHTQVNIYPIGLLFLNSALIIRLVERTGAASVISLAAHLRRDSTCFAARSGDLISRQEDSSHVSIANTTNQSININKNHHQSTINQSSCSCTEVRAHQTQLAWMTVTSAPHS
jgi:hypothetical protein